MMSFKIIFSLTLTIGMIVNAQEEPHPAPEPYNFSFSSSNDDGSSTVREETGDANGRITGYYIIKGLDGQDRRVDYVADENGFHAEVNTNEISTVSHEPAAAIYRSNGPDLSQLNALWASAGGNREQYAALLGLSPAAFGVGLATTGVTTTGTATGYRTATTTTTTGAGASGSLGTSGYRSDSARVVTEEGYVLVPASVARSAGIRGIDATGFVRGGTVSTTTTTGIRTSQPLTISGTNFEAQPSFLRPSIVPSPIQTQTSRSSYYQTGSYRSPISS